MIAHDRYNKMSQWWYGLLMPNALSSYLDGIALATAMQTKRTMTHFIFFAWKKQMIKRMEKKIEQELHSLLSCSDCFCLWTSFLGNVARHFDTSFDSVDSVVDEYHLKMCDYSTG